MKRRQFAVSTLGLAGGLAVAPSWVHAGPKDGSLTLGMVLEPPGLDPTTGAASAIAEVVLYNVFETLTKIGPGGKVTPLLAERWSVSDDQKTYTFRLRPGVRFQNGKPCDAEAVRFSLMRAGAEGSVNKDKAFFASFASVEARDAQTVVITLKAPEPDFLFMMGQATAIIVEPDSVAANATKPVGTGPYQLARWNRGSSLTLSAWPGFRDPASIRIKRVSFRFISEPAAQVAALLARDVDAFPRGTEHGVGRFQKNPAYQVMVSGSRAKTVLAINNARAPLDDVRVRRAIAAAIDRKAVLAAGQKGYGTPIGSHYVPGAPGYVDTTGINAHDPDKARALLKEAGITTPLKLTITLPPPAYARQGAEVVMAQLAKVGIICTGRPVEWAQWLEGTYRHRDYDLTIISHVEPLDLGNFVKSGYYWGYESPRFKALYERIRTELDEPKRLAMLGEAQRMLAEDCVLAWLYQPHWVTIADRKLQGLWDDMPILCNDLSALHWG
ncbi:MAG: ABC transporter substrate-binding protein [Lautropia sp.]|nr:ABC transporter substrate-binding protein [Lautropia sp.]